MTFTIDFKRNFAWLAACMLLAACSSANEEFPPPSPALWEVTAEDGTTEGWLFGTIHELPDGVNWRTAKLENALGRSEWLMVEVSNLDDSNELSRIFAEMAMSPNQPPLYSRVAPEYHARLQALMGKGDFGDDDFAQVETWAAALTLANQFSEGDPRNGVDRVLLSEFAAHIELEGARYQLGIFDGLAEEDQRDLLEGIIRESAPPEGTKPFSLAKTWITGNVDQLLDEDTDTILSDPELRAALLTDRNTAWIDTITREMDAKGPVMVAVGAAHMVGDTGLPALLQSQGYTVNRIQ